MRDTLQAGFEALKAVPEGKQVPTEVHADASHLYNQAMARAIAIGVLVPFADGQATIGDTTVDLDFLKEERVKVSDGSREISREQREVVYGRGRTELDGQEYDMFRHVYWAPGAQRKESVQGTVRSFRVLGGILGKIAKELGEERQEARKALVSSATLTAQNVLDRQEGSFATFFPWQFRDGKEGTAFLAVERAADGDQRLRAEVVKLQRFD